MSKVEVFLDQDQVKNLKSILNQSEIGIHLLFDNGMITEAFQQEFSEETFFEVGNLKKIQDDLLRLLQFKSLSDKQDFIRNLTEDSKHRIVRAYFYIIENNLRQNQKRPH